MASQHMSQELADETSEKQQQLEMTDINLVLGHDRQEIKIEPDSLDEERIIQVIREESCELHKNTIINKEIKMMKPIPASRLKETSGAVGAQDSGGSSSHRDIRLVRGNDVEDNDDNDEDQDESDSDTVKYLPLNTQMPGAATTTTTMATTAKPSRQQYLTNENLYRNKTESSDFSKPDVRRQPIYSPSLKDQHWSGGNTLEGRVCVTEHIKKNLTLLETNLQVYDIGLPQYRGHLQQLIVQKQPSKVQFQTRPVSDQYTQYRPSDFDIKQSRHIEHQIQPVVEKKASESPKEATTFVKKVNSLNQLLKKPIDFVKQRTQPSIAAPETQSENLESLGFYKVPIQRNQFANSQSIYLLPAPDPKVHIATVVIKNIILSHQRARQQSELHNQNPNKLTEFFKTYSLRRYQAKQRPSLVTKRTLSLSRADRFNRSKENRSREPNLDHSVNRIKAKVKMPSGKTDKATILDNKDGTVKITYEPKEIGQHEIGLRFNDEPIDEGPIVFYVDAVGSAKKKITAYGSALTHGHVFEPCKFTINTGGLGSAKLNVTVEGPGKTPVALNDNKDGTISVTYTPPTSGEYKIKISFDGKQVVGSPFTTTITDDGRQRSHLNVGRGSEHAVDVKINEEDLKALNAMIQTPCGLEEPCGLKLMKTGQLAIIFTPREQGEHVVSVKRIGNHIGASPFKFDVLSRDIGDAKQVRISGKNLKEGKTNAENEIVINTKEAGFGGLSVALEGPGKSEICSKEATDGTIKLSYKPYEPGHYSLIVKYADHVVPGSPFNIKVDGQGTNVQRDSIRKFRKLVTQVDANTECQFSFKLPGTSAYDLSAKIHSPQGKTEDASIKDKGDYVYLVSFTPKEVGLYSLSIRNKEIHLQGSPFPFTVGPFVDSGSHRVRCSGPGLIRGACGKLNEFNVFTREAGAGELKVLVEGPSKPELSFTDRKDGGCHVGYKVSEPGEYRVSVMFNDLEVPDSPFRAQIMPSSGEVSKIELGPMPPESMIQLNKPCNMTVIMNGAKGNIEGKVRLPTGKVEDCFASPIDAENWGVRFIPRELGVHRVDIKFNKGASHIPQSPVFIRVGHDRADPAAVLAHGHGLKSATVNHITDFLVETCSAGQALLEVNIEGPSKVSMGCSEIDEGYRINYTPLAPGDYLISIKYSSCHIGGSPFKVRAVKQPGSRTIADAGSHEISTISVATSEREAKQKVENMPKFKSDASRVYCKGMGLKKAFTGKPNTLTVNCSEAGFNMIYASFIGPTRNTIYECSVKHMGGSIYEVKYTCKDKGEALLMVKYGDEQIPGSPFRLECI